MCVCIRKQVPTYVCCLCVLCLLPLFCRTRVFPRWMNGTCLEAPPKVVPEQDEPVHFTFFSDVQLHPTVLELASTVQHNIQKGITEALRYLAGWKRKYKPLWRMQMVRGCGAYTLLVMRVERGSFVVDGELERMPLMCIVLTAYLRRSCWRSLPRATPPVSPSMTRCSSTHK